MQVAKKHLLLSLKIVFILAAFWFIYQKADMKSIWGYLKQASLPHMIAAYLCLLAAQIASAYRSRFYFKSSGLELSNKFSIGLYFTAMFFNTILPGGIGGDGYKIYILKKLADFPKMQSFRLLISDRASGLFVLIIFAIIAACFTGFMQIMPFANWLLLAAFLLLIPSYFLSIKLLLKEKPKTAIRAAFYSFFVQGFGVLMVLFIIFSLNESHISADIVAGYLFVFLVSSILAVLPISIGGLGIREISFLYGALLLGLDAEFGIAIAVIYFVINIICSLNGLYFWHKLERLYKN